MSAELRQIKEGIQRLANTFGKDYVSTVDCNVTAVNESNRTCSVEPITTSLATGFNEVALTADPNDGFICYPEIDSTVRVAVTNKGEKYILQFSDLSKIRITIGNSEIVVKDSDITFNDGNLGGLVKLNDLITKLNNLENKVNAIISTFNSHTHIGNLGAPTAPPTIPISGTLTPTQKTDLENTKIKQ
jgi:hypothetical protein